MYEATALSEEIDICSGCSNPFYLDDMSLVGGRYYCHSCAQSGGEAAADASGGYASPESSQAWSKGSSSWGGEIDQAATRFGSKVSLVDPTIPEDEISGEIDPEAGSNWQDRDYRDASSQPASQAHWQDTGSQSQSSAWGKRSPSGRLESSDFASVGPRRHKSPLSEDTAKTGGSSGGSAFPSGSDHAVSWDSYSDSGAGSGSAALGWADSSGRAASGSAKLGTGDFAPVGRSPSASRPGEETSRGASGSVTDRGQEPQWNNSGPMQSGAESSAWAASGVATSDGSWDSVPDSSVPEESWAGQDRKSGAEASWEADSGAVQAATEQGRGAAPGAPAPDQATFKELRRRKRRGPTMQSIALIGLAIFLLIGGISAVTWFMISSFEPQFERVQLKGLKIDEDQKLRQELGRDLYGKWERPEAIPFADGKFRVHVSIRNLGDTTVELTPKRLQVRVGEKLLTPIERPESVLGHLKSLTRDAFAFSSLAPHTEREGWIFLDGMPSDNMAVLLDKIELKRQ